MITRKWKNNTDMHEKECHEHNHYDTWWTK